MSASAPAPAPAPAPSVSGSGAAASASANQDKKRRRPPHSHTHKGDKDKDAKGKGASVADKSEMLEAGDRAAASKEEEETTTTKDGKHRRGEKTSKSKQHDSHNKLHLPNSAAQKAESQALSPQLASQAQSTLQPASAPTNPNTQSAPHTSKSKSKSKPSSKSKSKRDKEKDKDKDRASRSKAPLQKLKVIVRRLPPNLPEEIFWNVVRPWVRDLEDVQVINSQTSAEAGQMHTPLQQTIEWKRFVEGKIKESRQGTLNDARTVQHRHSRAYIRFTSLEALVEFHRNFDGHGFRDSKGNEYTAIVEFAPNQKVPGMEKAKKADARVGTIDEDATYLGFIAALENPGAAGAGEAADKENQQGASSVLSGEALQSKSSSAGANVKKTTPLLDHLRAQQASAAAAAAAASASSKKSKSQAHASSSSSGHAPSSSQNKLDTPKGPKKSKKEAATHSSSSAIPSSVGSTPKKDKSKTTSKAQAQGPSRPKDETQQAPPTGPKADAGRSKKKDKHVAPITADGPSEAHATPTGPKALAAKSGKAQHAAKQKAQGQGVPYAQGGEKKAKNGAKAQRGQEQRRRGTSDAEQASSAPIGPLAILKRRTEEKE